MNRCLKMLICLAFLATSFPAASQNAAALRRQAVGFAAKGDYASAAPLLSQSAELGYYVAQLEYAVLLDSSPAPVNDNIKAFAWYSVVIARQGTDTDFAKERLALVAKRLSQPDAEQANQLASALIAKYGQSAK